MIEANRRTFLKSLGSLAGLVLLQSLPSVARASAAAHSRLPQDIGADYLAQFGSEIEIADLGAFIGEAEALYDTPRLVEIVRSRVKADYQNRDVYRWNNWVLSRTEGRLCALAHLQGASPDSSSTSPAAAVGQDR